MKRNRKIKDRVLARANVFYIALIGIALWLPLSTITVLLLEFFVCHVPLKGVIVMFPIIAWALTMLGVLLHRHIGLIMVYLQDIDRGALIAYMDKYTAYSATQKKQIAKFVYPRNEWREINRIEGITPHDFKPSTKEGEELKGKSVFMPSESIIDTQVYVTLQLLIHAHTRIRPLDKEILELFNLTEHNVATFDLKKMIDDHIAGKDKKKRRTAKKK